MVSLEEALRSPSTIYEVMAKTNMTKEYALQRLGELRDAGVVRMRRGLWKLDNEYASIQKPVSEDEPVWWKVIPIPKEGSTIPQIALALDISEHAVEQSLKRSMSKLRKAMEL